MDFWSTEKKLHNFSGLFRSFFKEKNLLYIWKYRQVHQQSAFDLWIDSVLLVQKLILTSDLYR